VLSGVSGVPQGSGVGPSLFKPTLPGSVRSRVRLFANDTIVYLTIKSHASAQSLQEYVHNLELKNGQWSLTLTSVKFSEYTDKRNQFSSHTLHDTNLRTTEKAKYIGVTFSSNLNWSSHITTITNMANTV